MKKHRSSFKALALAMSVLMIASLFVGVSITPAVAASTGTTYYVSTSGNDSNDGLSPSSAWQTLGKVDATHFNPGDTIELKCGDSWNNQQLTIDGDTNGRGTAGAPITVTSYGTGAKPHIVYNGNTVYITEASYWTISGLEIEDSDTVQFNPAQDYTNCVRLNDSGAVERLGIVIENNDIHGSLTVPNTRVNGIYFNGGNYPDRPELADCLIQSNNVHDVGANGIYMCCWNTVPNQPTFNSINQSNLKIFNNTVSNYGMNGILVYGANHSKIQWNLVQNGGTNTVIPAPPDGIWYAGSTDCYVRFNKVDNQSDCHGIGDGLGLDIDFYCSNDHYDYNYVCNCFGGGLLTCSSDGSSANYNRFENDFNTGGKTPGHQGYFATDNAIANFTATNNLLLMGADVVQGQYAIATKSGSGRAFTNNHLVFQDSAIPANAYLLANASDVSMLDGNHIYGVGDASFYSVSGGTAYNSLSSWQTGTGFDTNTTLIGSIAQSVPTTPANLTGSCGNGQVSLSWSGSSDTGGNGLWNYLIFRSTDPNFTPAYTNLVGETTDTSTTFSDSEELGSAQIYYYKVVAEDNCGSWSAPSAPACVSVPYIAPTPVDPNAPTCNLLQNPSFETGTSLPDNWTFNIYSANVTYTYMSNGGFNGDRYLRIIDTTPYHANYYGMVSQQINHLLLNTDYVVTLWVRTDNANSAQFGGGTSWEFPFENIPSNTDGQWVPVSLTFNSGSTTSYTLRLLIQDVTDQLDVDMASVVPADNYAPPQNPTTGGGTDTTPPVSSVIMTPGTYGSQNLAITYTDGWSAGNAPGFMDGKYEVSNTFGQSFQFTYNGGSATIYGNKNSMYGTMAISVDNEPVTYVSVYSAVCNPSNGTSMPLYTVNENGQHTVTVTVSDQQLQGSDTQVVLDKVVIAQAVSGGGLTATSPTGNLIKNPDFASGTSFPDNWSKTISGNADVSFSYMTDGSQHYLRMADNSAMQGGTYGMVYQTVNVVPNTDYTATIWVRTDNANNDAFGYGTNWDMANPEIPSDTAGQWVPVSVTFNSGSNTTYTLRIIVQNTTTQLDVGMASIVPTTTIGTSPAGNLIQNPSFATGTTFPDNWSKSISGNADVSFNYLADGNQHYLRLTDNSAMQGNVYGMVYQTVNVVPNTDYVVTLWVRADGVNNDNFGYGTNWDMEAHAIPADTNGQWEPVSFMFNSGSNTTYTLRIIVQDITTQLDVGMAAVVPA